MTKEHAPEPAGWLLVRRYPDESTALAVYDGVYGLLFTEDLDASVFRLSLNGLFHVAMIGEQPLASDDEHAVNAIFATAGEPAELPAIAIDELRERRRAFKATGAGFFERRTRPFDAPPT